MSAALHEVLLLVAVLVVIIVADVAKGEVAVEGAGCRGCWRSVISDLLTYIRKLLINTGEELVEAVEEWMSPLLIADAMI
jgi:competence protein ComGC